MKPREGSIVQRTSLSDATLQQILARAEELDDRADARISVKRAREIALELGVSPESWDAALAEHERATSAAPQPPRVRAWHLGRHLLIAAGSIGLGLASGVAEGLNNVVEDVIGLGGFAILVGITLALMLANLRVRAQSRLQVDLVAWWWPFPIAYFIGYGRVFDDVLFICGPCWFLAAVFGGAAIEYSTSARGVRDTPVRSGDAR